MSNTCKYILSVLCPFLMFISCTRGDLQTEKMLSDAQLSVDSNPHYALGVLEGTIGSQKLTARQYALWCLLLTKAMDKAYHPHTSDSLISIAMQYYEKSNESDLLLEAYYYMGRVNNDLGNALKAQNYYLKALDTGKYSDDSGLLMRICYNIGSLYLYQNVSDLALKHLREALGYAQVNRDSVFQMYTLREIARYFSSENIQDSALAYYHESLNYADSTCKTSLLNELGGTYRRLGMNEKSYKYLKEALIHTHGNNAEEDFLHIHLNLGRTYQCMNQPDSAELFLRKSFSSNYPYTKADASYYLYELAKQGNDTGKALYYLEQSHTLRSSIAEADNAASLRKVQTLYNHQQSENIIKDLKLANAEAKSNLYKIMLIVLLCVVVVIVVVFVLVDLLKRYNIKKKEVDLMTSEIKIGNLRLGMSENRIAELELHIKESIGELERERCENIQLKNEQRLREQAIGRLESSDVFLKFHTVAASHNSEIKITVEDIKALEQIIEETYQGFANKIMQQSSSVDDVDLYLCYLHKIGITSPKKITKFIHKADNSIVSRRDRLYKKLHGVKGTAELFMEYINSL